MSAQTSRGAIHRLACGPSEAPVIPPQLSARRSAIEGVITPVIALRGALGRTDRAGSTRAGPSAGQGPPGSIAELVDQAVAGGFDFGQAALEVCGPAVPGIVHFERASGDRSRVELPQQAHLGGVFRSAGQAPQLADVPAVGSEDQVQIGKV
mgnify:CR=1 FL=1